MVRLGLLVSFVYVSLSLGSVIAPRDEQVTYDAIVVGGGPSGLAALSGLARVRRNVLMIDSGKYRNDPTRKMHDVLGFDGVTPAYYRTAAREQIAHYDTVTMTNGTVTKIEPQNNNTSFEVTSYMGSGEKTFKARKIILATGLMDILPSTPGLKEAWGKGIFWCPWCDGHEYADQPLGLLAPLTEIPGLVREILTLNRDIVAFVNGTDTEENRVKAEEKSPQWETYLELNNVTVENRVIERITRLEEDDDSMADHSLPSVAHTDFFAVEFGEGEPVERAGFLASFPSKQTSNVGEEMGVDTEWSRMVVEESKGFLTSIPGVYAVGDSTSKNVTNVPFSLYSGKRSAVFLHVALERETAAEQLKANGQGKKNKRSINLEPRDVWNQMNDSPDDMLYAGEFHD